MPRAGGPITRALGRSAMRLMGWRFEGELPNVPKMVVIVAPHTSNWDVVVGIAAKLALGVRARWLAKHTIFRGPAGALFRALGAIPIDRRSPHNVVESCARQFAASEAMVLALAPEGTRKAVAEWKTGFWHIARASGVPIVAVAFDWRRRVLRIGPAIAAEESVEEQLPMIKALFSDVSGREERNGVLPT